MGTLSSDLSQSEVFFCIGISMHRQRILFHFVTTRRTPRSLTSLLHRRQKQTNKNPNYGDHDQQFDQRKARSLMYDVFISYENPKQK